MAPLASEFFIVKRISASPTSGLSYSPVDSVYWDRAGLDAELERVFDICHGCRMCFNLCPSFPALFDAVDASAEEDVRALSTEQREQVVDLCYGCKLCHVKCPYTPEDGHEFKLDFPRLMLRSKALRVKEEGKVPLRERVLGDPEAVGKAAGLAPSVVNWANRTRFHRVAMEKLLGVHRDKLLPDFASTTFRDWFDEEGPWEEPEEPARKVAMFHTCFVQHNNPEPGKAAVRVLAKNECAVTCPKQTCCGMPALDSGDVEFARKQAQANVDSLLPLVRDGHQVVAINPTCSLTMRQEYPRLLGTPESQELADAVRDTHELLFELKKEKKLHRDFKSTPGEVAWHVPCHLKAQAIGFRSRDLMKLIPGSSIKMIDGCCAHDGTWAMKTENFELSMKWGKKVFDGVEESGASVVATDCPLAALQLEQGTGREPIHPVEVLDRAYRADGFDTPVPSPDEGESP